MRKTSAAVVERLSSGLEVAGEIRGTPAGTVTLPARAKLALAAQSPTMQFAPSSIICLARTSAICSLPRCRRCERRPRPPWQRRPRAPRRDARTCGRRRRSGRSPRSGTRLPTLSSRGPSPPPSQPEPRRARRARAAATAPRAPRTAQRSGHSGPPPRGPAGGATRRSCRRGSGRRSGPAPDPGAAVPAGSLGQPEGGGDEAPAGRARTSFAPQGRLRLKTMASARRAQGQRRRAVLDHAGKGEELGGAGDVAAG